MSRGLKVSMHVRRALITSVLLAVGAPGGAIGAQTPTRGPWISVEGSFARLSFQCADCSAVRLGLSEHLSGPGAGLEIGWTASDRLRLGLHASGFYANDATAGSGNNVVSVLATGLIRPKPTIPLSLRLGVGGMWYWEGASNTYRGKATGLAFELGLQYEASLSDHWLLTPFASYTRAVTSHASVDGSAVSQGLEPRLLGIGVGLVRN